MFEELEQAIDYSFKEKSLLELAMTHPSYAGETHVHNRRLAFLGDAVLQLCTSVRLYHQSPDLPEGKLSRLRARCVQEGALEVAARRLNLGNYLLLGHGEEHGGGREKPSILADAMEAIFGAVFLDGGFAEAQRVILGLYRKILADLPERMGKDPKTQLQELLQANHLPVPAYRVVSCVGKPNAQTFVSECFIEHFGIRTDGTGSNRRTAEQNAAAAALRVLNERPEAKKLKGAAK